MSLYRKYRPQTLADVVGQDHVVTTLENAAAQDALAHAYLFAGSRGTGKTSVARILAKLVMTRGIEDETLQRQIIRGIEDGSLVDLLEIDAASNRGIDDIRDLVEKIQFRPVAASAKVYIIDEVHMLTKEAFNALLKTLEEPPPYAFFILATTELHKIPSTIQSRCQCFPFRRIIEEDIIRRLQYIADQERIVVDREALRSIAAHVEGGMRDAVSLLDQMRSLPKITATDVESRIGSAGRQQVQHVFTALDAGDRAGLLQAIREVELAGIPLDSFIRQLLTMSRERLHQDIEAERDVAESSRLLSALLDAIRDIRISPVPGLVLETALLAFCGTAGSTLPAPARTASARIKEPVREEPQMAPAAAEEPVTKSALIEAPELSIDSVRKVWPQIVAEATPAAVKMSLKDAHVSALDGTKVVVSFSSGFHRDTVMRKDAVHRIEEVMEKIFKRSLRLDARLESEREHVSRETDSVNLAEAAAEIF